MSLTTAPVAGTYTAPQLISLTDAGSDAIYYTVDGSVPQYAGYARNWNDGLLASQTNVSSNGTATFTNPGAFLRQTLTAASSSATSFLDSAPVPGFAATESSIRTKFRFNAGSCYNDTQACVVYRCAGKFTANDTYGYVVYVNPFGTVKFARGSNASTGSYTFIGSAQTTEALAYDTFHTLTVTVRGTTHTVSVNGVVLGVWQDSTYTVPGYVGVRTYAASATAPVVDYDDFLVEYYAGTKYTAPVPVVPATDATTIKALSVTAAVAGSVSSFAYTIGLLRIQKPAWSVLDRTVALSATANGAATAIGSTGTYTDARDGRTYKTVLMPDGNWWFAENFRYVGVGGSYGSSTYGAVHGRWYDRATAITLTPSGCHLPTNAEYSALMAACGGINDTTSSKLRAKTTWASPGTDIYGFGVLASGSTWGEDTVGSVGSWGALVTSDPGNLLWYFTPSIVNSDNTAAYSVRYIVDSGNTPDPAAPADMAIYYTTDGSVPSFHNPPTWAQLPVAGPYDVCFGPNGRVVAGCSSSLYYSTTGGGSWTNANVSLATWQYYGICYNAVDGNYYVANYTGGIYRVSADFTTKTSLGQGSNYPFKIRAATDGTLYAIGVSCYKSTDFGVTWSLACSPPGAGTYTTGAFLPDGRLMLVTGDGSQATSKVTVYNPSDSSQTELAAIPYALGVVVSQSGRAYLGTTSPTKTLTAVAPYSTWTVLADGLIGGGDTSGTQVIGCDEQRKIVFYLEAGDAVTMDSNTFKYTAPIPYSIGMVISTLAKATGYLDSLPNILYPYDTVTGSRSGVGFVASAETGQVPSVRAAWMRPKLTGQIGMPAMLTASQMRSYTFTSILPMIPPPTTGTASTKQATAFTDEGIQVSVFPRQPTVFDNRVDWGNGPVTNRSLKLYWRVPKNDNYLVASTKTDVKKTLVFGDLDIVEQSDTWSIGGAQAKATLKAPPLSHYIDVSARLGFVQGAAQSQAVRVTGGRNSSPMAIWLSPGEGNVRLNIPVQCTIYISDPDLDTVNYSVTANGTQIKAGVATNGTTLSFEYVPVATGDLSLSITLTDPFDFQSTTPAPALTVLDNDFPVCEFQGPATGTAVYKDTYVNVLFDISDKENELMTWTLLNNNVTIASGTSSNATTTQYRFKVPAGRNDISLVLADPLGAGPAISGPTIWGSLCAITALTTSGALENGADITLLPTISGTPASVSYEIESSAGTQTINTSVAPYSVVWTPNLPILPNDVVITATALDATGHGPSVTKQVTITGQTLIGTLFATDNPDILQAYGVVISAGSMSASEQPDTFSGSITPAGAALEVHITSTVPAATPVGTPLLIQAKATDSIEGISSMTLEYQLPGTSTWVSVPMQTTEF